MGKVDLKEKIAGYFLLAIAIIITLSAINISLSIISYSFYTGMLIWGIIAVVLIMILTCLLSGFILLVKNLLIASIKSLQE